MIAGDEEWLSLEFAKLATLPAPTAQPVKAKKEITTATTRLYDAEAKSWEKFKSKVKDSEIRPGLLVLKLYFRWFALTHNGKLDARPTQSTLVWRVGRFSYMYADYYGEKIPEEVKDAVVYYIQHELAGELGLTTKTYEKNFATDVDVDEMLEYLWKEDTHCYRNERLRLYEAFVISILADSGARIGAILRSECYRDGNDALRYEDVQVLVVRNKRGGVHYRLDVTFHNMKGARLDDSKFLKLTIKDRKSVNLGSSSVFLFLMIAWMDGAFDGITSLHQLFHLEDHIPDGVNAICIPYKSSFCSRPIVRRMEKRGSSRISDTLAWSSGSALNQLKRICKEGGWPQRMTSYNIRRGVLNKLDGAPNVSSAQRNQIAGHGNSAVFTKKYLSEHSEVVVSKFFKGRATRIKDEDDDDDNDDVRGMRLQRDRNVPPELPEHLWEQITKTDKDLQIIKENRKLVRYELDSALTNGPPAHVARLREQLQQLTRKLYQQTQNLKNQEYTKFRAEWFKTRASNVLRPLDASLLHGSYKTTEFSPARKAVIEALYPADASKLSMFSAAEALVLYLNDSAKAPTNTGNRSKRGLDPAIKPPKKRACRMGTQPGKSNEVVWVNVDMSV